MSQRTMRESVPPETTDAVSKLSAIREHYRELGEESLLEEIGQWLDSSKIAELDLCPRKYYYRHERHLVSYQPLASINWASALTFGHALHAALATFYDGTAMQPSTCPCEFPISIGCEKCKGEQIPKILARFLINYPDDPTDERDPRTRDRGVQILIAYINKWRQEEFKVVGVELPFAVPFYDEHGFLLFNYIGRIDLLIEEHGRVKPLDHKTTTRFGQMFEQQFRVSHQMTGYIKSTHMILGEHTDARFSHEAEINAIRITTKIDDDSFARITTSRSPEEYDEWIEDTKQKYNELQLYRLTGYWPKRNPFACAAYNRQCEYYRLCSAPPSLREELIQSGYIVQKWNPIGDHD